MIGISPAIANRLWLLSALPEELRFRRALRHVSGCQWGVLKEILARNSASDFGRRHRFDSIGSVADFRGRVPLSDYEDYRQAVEGIAAGGRGVLTAAPVTLLEPTGGSTAAAKLIPYGAPLRAEFQRAIAPWIVDLYRRHPALLRGRSYWSISPAAREEARTAGGLPVGFEDDTAYLGRGERLLARQLLAVPSAVSRAGTMESFWYLTLLFLLRASDLSLISVWNPTFLLILAGRLDRHREALVEDIAAGTLSPPDPLADSLSGELRALTPPDPARAARVDQAFRAASDPGERHLLLWPQLSVVSCWTDAHAGTFLPELRRVFPRVAIEGKGLLATEGVVSIPVGPGGSPLPALRSHFFEFLPEGGREPRLLHELSAGEVYSVVLTTGGGLYRYRLRDRVEVTGHLGEAPLLRFVGKEEGIVDRFGEKLGEAHVRSALAAALQGEALEAAFTMVAFEEGESAYALFIEAAAPEETLRRVGASLEEGLRGNFHYRYCRDLGQLGPLRVFPIQGEGMSDFLAACQARGQRPGEVKPVALHGTPGWSRVFAGRFLGPESRV